MSFKFSDNVTTKTDGKLLPTEYVYLVCIWIFFQDLGLRGKPEQIRGTNEAIFFIHTEDLHNSASSRKLLRGAPSPNTAKKSFT